MADREVLDLGQSREDERRDREDVKGRTGDVEQLEEREPSEDALGDEQPLGCVLRIRSISEGDSSEGRRQAGEQVLQRGHLDADAQVFEFEAVESGRREDGGRRGRPFDDGRVGASDMQRLQLDPVQDLGRSADVVGRSRETVYGGEAREEARLEQQLVEDVLRHAEVPRVGIRRVSNLEASTCLARADRSVSTLTSAFQLTLRQGVERDLAEEESLRFGLGV